MQLTTNSTPILTPAETAELLITPFLQQSVAAQVLQTVRITSGTYRVPTIAKEVQANWTKEGEEIAPSDLQFGEVEIHPAKVAGLVVVSRELAHDSSPAATDAVGASLVRQLVKATDEALFKTLPDPAPKGLTSLSGTSAVALPFTNVDPFSAAIAAAERSNARLTAFVAGPDVALKLANLKKGTGSNESLLAPDSTSPAARLLAGVPLVVSNSVEANTVWGIPGDGMAQLVIREDAEVRTDESAFFTRDSVAVRGVLRVAFAFPHPLSVVKILDTDAA